MNLLPIDEDITDMLSDCLLLALPPKFEIDLFDFGPLNANL